MKCLDETARKGESVESAQLESWKECNEKLIEEFVDDLPPMTSKRLDKHRSILRHVSDWWLRKPFDQAARKDLVRVIGEINAKEDFKDWTKADYRRITKRFFRWLQNTEFVEGIKVGEPAETVGPEDVLTDEELFRYFQAGTNLRDKALAQTQYETAFRPHELLSLKKNSVEFDDYGAIIYVAKGKTGARRVRVVNAGPLLANWIENHPLKARDAPLWVDLSNNTKYTAIKWRGLNKIIGRLSASASIQKDVTAYTFRHTRLTHLAKFMTEAQLCEFAGWTQGSDMSRMYVHLSGRDTDEALLKAYGLKKEDSANAPKVPKKCVRCGTLCESGAEICAKCGMALTLTAAMKKDDEIKALTAEFERQKKSWEEKFLSVADVLDDIKKARLKELQESGKTQP